MAQISQFISANALAIIGLVIAAITATGVFYGPKLVAKSQEKKESLRNHFKHLETIVIKPISDTMRGIATYGEALSIKGASYGSLHYATLIRNFEQGDFYIFKLHFPELAKKVTKQLNEVNQHNEHCKSFTNKLKELIEEKTGLTVTKGKERPFIYEDVPHYLRQTLHQLAKAESPTHDFRQVTIERKNDFWQVHTVSTIYAEVTAEQEGNLCKTGLIELMESSSLLEKISDILKRANQLENDSRSIADLLDLTCRQYGVGQLLNEEKECPYCQVIFHPKKRSKNV